MLSFTSSFTRRFGKLWCIRGKTPLKRCFCNVDLVILQSTHSPQTWVIPICRIAEHFLLELVSSIFYLLVFLLQLLEWVLFSVINPHQQSGWSQDGGKQQTLKEMRIWDWLSDLVGFKGNCEPCEPVNPSPSGDSILGVLITQRSYSYHLRSPLIQVRLWRTEWPLR